MAAKKRGDDAGEAQQTNRSTNEDKWGGFIDLRLTPEQKEEFGRYEAEIGSILWEDFEDSLGDGLKFALAWDKENQCFVASFSGNSGALRGYRYVLTARSDGWERAIHLLVFKHVVVLEKNWGRYKPATYGVEV